MLGGLFGVFSPGSNLGESGGAEAAALKLGAEKSCFLCCCTALYILSPLFVCQTCRRPSPSSTTASRTRPWTTESCTWTKTRTGSMWVARTTSSPWTSTMSRMDRSRLAAQPQPFMSQFALIPYHNSPGHFCCFSFLFRFPKQAIIICELALFSDATPGSSGLIHPKCLAAL